MNQQELYQKLYDNPKRKYGQAEFDRCPGVRLMPKYKEYLHGRIIDFGCGTGDTVKVLREQGYDIFGYDFIKPGIEYCYNQDITKEFKFDLSGEIDVGLCIDVVEHINDVDLIGLIINLSRCKAQIISIHNGPSTEGGDVELHINKKAFTAWERFLSRHIKIKHTIRIHDFQMLYVCERKKHD